MTDPRNGLKDFALDVYGCDGVPAAAVLLQDRCGVDVNLLLLAAHVGAVLGSSFTGKDLAAANARTRAWQRDVIGPLRAVRTRLKDGPPPAPNTATATLRERIKALELDAEMIELAELSDFETQLDSAAAPGGAEERAAAAMQVVVGGGAAREPRPDERGAITVIASAAAQFSRR